MVGSLTLKAKDQVEAVILAEIFLQLKNDNKRIRQLKKEATQRYCKKHNVCIVAGG
jgi:hypothetical protein